MNEVGEHIIQEQNTESSIKYLGSQKEIYSSGKSTFAYQVFIAVPIPIIISIVTPLLDNTTQRLAWVFILYSIIATFCEFYFEDKVSKLKKDAALIQEKFDCSVLMINWNKTLLPKKPVEEIVFRFYKKHIKKNKLDNLYDWYSKEVEPVSTNVASLLCQRTNCSYDFSLRKRYTNTILLLALATFLILFIISGFYSLSLTTFIANVLFPSLPVFVLAYKQIKSNKDAIDNLSELKDLIECELENLNINDIIDIHLIRQIQDKIYLKRINSPLLPEWAYNLLRQNLEEEMNFSVKEKIRELSI